MPLEPSANFRETIDAFAAALGDPRRSPTTGACGREGVGDARRFAIYRNNVAVSLIASLAARYPVTRGLVGDDFFRATARVYVAANKPQSPVLIHYGQGFPDFIARYEPARDLPHLADVAGLENAWVEAYHAADAAPIEIGALAAFDVEGLMNARCRFHPAARFVNSDYPIASIWSGRQRDNAARTIDKEPAEAVMVTRPAADVLTRLLPPGGYAFADTLRRGATIAEAYAATAIDGFDAGAHLIGLIEAGALIGLES